MAQPAAAAGTGVPTSDYLNPMKEMVLGRPLEPFDQGARMPEAQAHDAYMRTGRNPNLGPAAPYGVFTPGGTADLMARAGDPGPGSSSLQGLQMGVAALSGLNGMAMRGETPRIDRGSGIGYSESVAMNGLPTDRQAQLWHANTGFMPDTTVGGAYGSPGRTPLPFEKTPATGAQIDSYLEQNPNGRFFQGATPGLIATARGMRQGFTDGQPLPDLSQKPKFDAGAYTTTPSGSLTPNSATQLEKGREAAAVFDARRGGLQARRDAYEAKVAGSAAERKAGVKENAQQRSEARRARRGLFTPEEQLNRANPEAYQARIASEANSKAQADRIGLTIASQERIAQDRNKTAKEVAGLKIQAEQGEKPPDLPPIPSAPKLPQTVVNDIRQKGSQGDVEGVREHLAANGITDKGEQNKIIQDVTGDNTAGLGFWEKPAHPPIGPAAPMTRGEALKGFLGGFMGPGGSEVMRGKKSSGGKTAPAPAQRKPWTKNSYVSPFLF